MASLGYHQLADPILWIGQAHDGVGRRYLGAHLVEAGLDGLDGGIVLGGSDEGLRRRDHVLVFECLRDNRGRVALVDLDDDVGLAFAGVVGATAEHGMPQP